MGAGREFEDRKKDNAGTVTSLKVEGERWKLYFG